MHSGAGFVRCVHFWSVCVAPRPDSVRVQPGCVCEGSLLIESLEAVMDIMKCETCWISCGTARVFIF